MNVLSLIPREFFFGLCSRRSQTAIRATACAVLISVLSSPLLAANTIVRMKINFGNTPVGNIDIELYDDQTPKTVLNFLHYAGYYYHLQCASFLCSSDYLYNDTNPILIHRSSPNFVIQGGGYYYMEQLPGLGKDGYTNVPEWSSVQDEYSPSRQNVAGTIAMALVEKNGKILPNSATGQWFINLDDNSTSLPEFTVFGHVLDPGMKIVNDIARLNVVYLGSLDPNDPNNDDNDFSYSPFTQLPVLDNYDSVTRPKLKPLPENLVFISRIPNVAATRTDLGTMPTYTADVDMVFSPIVTAPKEEALKILAGFPSPQNQTVQFNNGIHAFTMIGPMGPTGRTVTLHDGAATRPTHYYAYGKTPDNQTAHWYDFSYDSATGTGAEFVSNKILLHFVDGQRGDDDLRENDSITHAGAQAVVTSTTTSSSPASGGCSIAARNPGVLRSGDWMLVSLFLAVVALVRRRTRCSGRVGIAHRKQRRLQSDGGLCPPYV